MKKGNIIDLVIPHQQTLPEAASSVSDELETAIQNLIYRLRELGPLPSSN
jgi:hypothetical protein